MLSLLLCCTLLLLTVVADFDRPTVVIPVNLLGLANRLRIISSAYAVAHHSDRSLLVVWQNNYDCSIELTDLFVCDFDVVYVDPDASSFESSVRSYVYSRIEGTDSTAKEAYPQRFLFMDNSDSTVTTMWTRGTHAPTDMPCSKLLELKNSFYNKLRPTAMVLDYVNRVKNLFPVDRVVSPVIGVHIRAYDSEQDWPVVSPVSASQSAMRFDEAADMDAFLLLMQHILHRIPNVKFFVASNSHEAKQMILNMFGPNTVITLSSEGANGRHKDTMPEAAAEFWLLGQTDLIIHTRGSSFGREAANIANIPVIDVSRNGERLIAFYSQHRDLPYCAIPEYIRTSKASEEVLVNQDGAAVSDTEWDRVCYLEGPSDDPTSRVMCTVEYAVCLCSDIGDTLNSASLDAALLDVVYCPVTRSLYNSLADDIRHDRCTVLLAESNGYSL